MHDTQITAVCLDAGIIDDDVEEGEWVELLVVVNSSDLTVVKFSMFAAALQTFVAIQRHNLRDAHTM